jgi:hypothetical protein
MKINYLFLIFGIGLAWAGFTFALKTSNLINYGEKVEAKVIELSKGSVRNSKGQTSIVYYPVFEYVLAGKNYTQVSRVGTNPASFDVGEKTYLYIDPKNPSHFISDSFLDKWGIPSILAFMSQIFFALFFSMGRKSKSKRSIHLKDKGRFNVIFAEITSVTKKINDIYCFEASWTDPINGRCYTFYINDYHYPISEIFKGKQIEIAINPDNYAEYYPVLGSAPIAA